MTYSQEIITDMSNTATDMATIIGRYKGSMGVFADRVREIAEYEDCVSTKRKLEQLAESMTRIVAENEELWDNRGKREATDIVELERA